MHTIKRTVKFFTDKQFSTIAGTLVYFLIMSIAPFILWLTLLLGDVHLHLERFFDNELFSSVSPFLRYLKSSAESAASGAGIILLITTLYSSTNFFYHLRRSGELIYNSTERKSGVRLRLASLLIIFMTIVVTAIIAALAIVGVWFLEKYMPPVIADIVTYTFITALIFLVVLLLNMFACPYKIKAEQAVSGSLLTTALWLICLVGFAVYMQFANPERLYGKIASVIIFLLWCYIMMSCFVIGLIYNGSFVNRRYYKNLL